MNTLNYSLEYKTTFKVVLYFLLFLLASCISEEEEKDTRHLGFPRDGVVTLRTKPFALLSKIPDSNRSLKDSNSVSLNSNDESLDNSNLNLIEGYLSSFPSLSTLDSDFLLSLEPDLSTYWIMRAGIEGNSYFTSLYLKVGNISQLEQFLIDKAISTEEVNSSIKMSLIDDKLEEHLYLLRSQDHLLILMNWGEADVAKQIAESCIYPDKKTLLDEYEAFFSSKNDIDLKIKSTESLGKLLPSPILKDLNKGLDVNLSVNLLPNSLEIDIKPNPSWHTPLDSLLTSHSLKEAGLVSLSTEIELEKLHLFFDQYKLSGPVDYELKKIGLSLDQLEEQFNGHLYAAYLGEKITQSKSITYEYDENFNQVEKVVYTPSSSFDIKGLIGLNNRSMTEKHLTKNNLISKVGKNNYQPIIGSNSSISFSDSTLTIGQENKSEIVSNGKLLFQANTLKQLPEIKSINKALELIDIQRLTLFISEENKIRLKIKINGDRHSYLLKAKELLNPSL